MKPQIIDTRFLRLHPVTALWWQQRGQCRQCVNYIDSASPTLDGERCAAAVSADRRKGDHEYCIDARGADLQREDGKAGVCGIGGNLFAPRKS